MIEVRMLGSNEIKHVTSDVAIDLVGKGIATRDLRVKKTTKLRAPKKSKAPSPYQHRQMNPTNNIHRRKSF